MTNIFIIRLRTSSLYFLHLLVDFSHYISLTKLLRKFKIPGLEYIQDILLAAIPTWNYLGHSHCAKYCHQSSVLNEYHCFISNYHWFFSLLFIMNMCFILMFGEFLSKSPRSQIKLPYGQVNLSYFHGNRVNPQSWPNIWQMFIIGIRLKSEKRVCMNLANPTWNV